MPRWLTSSSPLPIPAPSLPHRGSRGHAAGREGDGGVRASRPPRSQSARQLHVRACSHGRLRLDQAPVLHRDCQGGRCLDLGVRGPSFSPVLAPGSHSQGHALFMNPGCKAFDPTHAPSPPPPTHTHAGWSLRLGQRDLGWPRVLPPRALQHGDRLAPGRRLPGSSSGRYTTHAPPMHPRPSPLIHRRPARSATAALFPRSAHYRLLLRTTTEAVLGSLICRTGTAGSLSLVCACGLGWGWGGGG